jgi:hypothetical protein
LKIKLTSARKLAKRGKRWKNLLNFLAMKTRESYYIPHLWGVIAGVYAQEMVISCLALTSF